MFYRVATLTGGDKELVRGTGWGSRFFRAAGKHLAVRSPTTAGSLARKSFTRGGKFTCRDSRFARRPVALHAPWDEQTPRTPSV